MVVNSNIYGNFATKILNYNVKKNMKQTNLLKTNTIDFLFERVEDVCPLPGAGQNNPLPLLLPPHVQIEVDILNGGPYPTWRSLEKTLPVVRLGKHKLREALKKPVNM